MRESEQRIPPTSCQRRSRVLKQMLVELRYSYLLVDETTTNRTEALQLLNHTTGDVSSVTKRWSDRWLRKRGSPKGGYGLVHVDMWSSTRSP